MTRVGLTALALFLATSLVTSPIWADEPAPEQVDPLAPSSPPAADEAKLSPEDISPGAAPPKEEGPWRLADQLPDWLHVEGSARARYAYVTNALRSGVRGDNRAISLRTTILLELRGDPFEIPLRAGTSRASSPARASCALDA